MNQACATWILIAAALLAPGCAFGSGELAKSSPPLRAMEEPAAWLTEPADELERAALDPGTFSGIEIGEARASLDALLEAPEGLGIVRVVENSPAAIAGVAAGDLLFRARRLPDGAPIELAWPSDWRAVELESKPGDDVELELDRAGSMRLARLTLVARVRPAERIAAARLREDQRAGIVVRAATEVEARAARLAPGAGAVVVGMTRESPWRAAGLRFEDLIVSVDGTPVAAPDVLIRSVLTAEGDTLRLGLLRGGETLELTAPLSRRAQELHEISFPFLFSYERQREESETRALLGLFQLRRTPAAWSLRLLWFIRFSGGDSDRLVEVDS